MYNFDGRAQFKKRRTIRKDKNGERRSRRPIGRVLCRPFPSGDGHSSGTPVAGRLARPTRAACAEATRRNGTLRLAAPIRSCSRWGLPCRPRCRGRGALLPPRFTLTGWRGEPSEPAVCFLWHYPWGRPRRVLPGTVPPWSPDLPHRAREPGAAVQPSGPNPYSGAFELFAQEGEFKPLFLKGGEL